MPVRPRTPPTTLHLRASFDSSSAHPDSLSFPLPPHVHRSSSGSSAFPHPLRSSHPLTRLLSVVVHRLVNSLMMKGRNNGKKLMAVRIVAHAFEIVHLLTDQNPIQVLVDAIINTGPREDSTRIGSAGTVRRQAVDVSPLRRSVPPRLGLLLLLGQSEELNACVLCIQSQPGRLPPHHRCTSRSLALILPFD